MPGREQLPDRCGDAGVRDRGGAPVPGHGPLVDDHRLVLGDQLGGEARLARARHPGEHREHAEGDVDVQVLQGVPLRPAHRQAAARAAGRAVEVERPTQCACGRGVGLGELGGRALEDQTPALGAGAGTDLEHVVGRRDHRGIVLDHEHRIALVAQLLEQAQHRGDVLGVQSDRRLVDHVQHLHQARAEMLHGLQTLGLPAREGGRRARQLQVAEPDVAHRPQAAHQGVTHGCHGRLVDPGDDLDQLRDLQPRHLADRETGQAGGAGGGRQAIARALRAGLRAGEVADRGGLALGELVRGVQVDPLEPLDDPLVVRGWAGAQAGRGLPSVQQRLPFALAPLPQRCVGVEAADVRVLPVPVAAVAEAGQPDRPARERAVEVQEAVDRAGDHLAETGTGRAHPAGQVEGEAPGVADVRGRQAGEQQPQRVPRLARRTHGGAGRAAQALLVDDDHGGDSVDLVDLGPGPARQAVPRERGIGLVELEAGLRGDRVEHQRGLPRAGEPGDDHQAVPGDVDVEGAQVVGPGAAEADHRSAHGSAHDREGSEGSGQLPAGILDSLGR